MEAELLRRDHEQLALNERVQQPDLGAVGRQGASRGEHARGGHHVLGSDLSISHPRDHLRIRGARGGENQSEQRHHGATGEAHEISPRLDVCDQISRLR